MLIETTTPFETQEDAEDSLAGIKELPGFLLGYVRLPSSPTQKYSVVHLFECTVSNPTLKLSQQRVITDFRSNPPTFQKLSSEHRTMLALLDYPNATGLHPVEARWRDFARALLSKPSHKELPTTAQPSVCWNHERAGLD